MEFSNMLKKVREEKGVSQIEVAEAIGVSPKTISLYETGKREPNFENMKKLESYFKVSAAYLRGETTSNNYDFYVGTLQLENQKLKEEIDRFMDVFQKRDKRTQFSMCEVLLYTFKFFSIENIDKDCLDLIALLNAGLNGYLLSIQSGNSNYIEKYFDYIGEMSKLIYGMGEAYDLAIQQNSNHI